MSNPGEYESRVRYLVHPLQQQHARTCWYTGALMLLDGVRTRYLSQGAPIFLPDGSHPLEHPRIVDTFRDEGLLARSNALPVDNIVKFLKKVDFEGKYTPVNPYIVQDMLTEYGPLLHMTKWHAVVITGITIVDEQTAILEFNDPGDGKRHTADFTQFFIDRPGLPQGDEHLLMYVSPTIHDLRGSKDASQPAPPAPGARDAGIGPDAGPHDVGTIPAGGVTFPRGTDAGAPDAGVQPFVDLSERIKILPGSDETPFDVQDRHVYLPDLSERIKILPDSDETPFDVQDRFEEIHENREPFKSFDQNPFDRFGADRLTGLSDHEERDSFHPNPFDRYGADQLKDFSAHEERDSFHPNPFDRFGADRLTGFSDHEEREAFHPNPFDRYGADQLKDLSDHEERDSFHPNPFDRFGADHLTGFSDHEERDSFHPNPFDRFGADHLTGFSSHEERDSFHPNPFDRFGADQLKDFSAHQDREAFKPFHSNPFDRFGADQFKEFSNHEPFQSFTDKPFWMRQGFSEPPPFGSLANQLSDPFADKRRWKK